MLSEKKLKVVTAFKGSKSPTHWGEEPDQEWELFWSLKSEKNIPTESWRHSQLSHHLKCLIPSLNLTMPPYQSINLLKMPMNAWSLIMKLFMISASELWNWPLLPMEIWTTWSLPPCQESPAVWDSQVNWTQIWENWLWIWFLSPVSISSWSDLHHWPPEDHNNTEHWLSPNWPNKCSMPKTWCAPLTPDTEDI